MSDLDNAINSINASAAKAENTAGFLDDMSTFDDQSSVTNPNNGQTVASISKQVKDRTDELFTAAESDINQAVSDAAQSATDAQDAADSIGRYQGLWPDSGGIANKGDTYQTQVSGTPTGQYFTALQNTTADPVGDDVNWREVVSVDSLSQYTGMVYKASGGNSAVENMIAGFPVASKLGDVVKCENGTEFKRVGDMGATSDFEVLSPSVVISDFGEVTGVDDTDTLQSAVNAMRSGSSLECQGLTVRVVHKGVNSNPFSSTLPENRTCYAFVEKKNGLYFKNGTLICDSLDMTSNSLVMVGLAGVKYATFDNFHIIVIASGVPEYSVNGFETFASLVTMEHHEDDTLSTGLQIRPNCSFKIYHPNGGSVGPKDGNPVHDYSGKLVGVEARGDTNKGDDFVIKNTWIKGALFYECTARVVWAWHSTNNTINDNNFFRCGTDATAFCNYGIRVTHYGSESTYDNNHHVECYYTSAGMLLSNNNSLRVPVNASMIGNTFTDCGRAHIGVNAGINCSIDKNKFNNVAASFAHIQFIQQTNSDWKNISVHKNQGTNVSVANPSDEATGFIYNSASNSGELDIDGTIVDGVTANAAITQRLYGNKVKNSKIKNASNYGCYHGTGINSGLEYHSNEIEDCPNNWAIGGFADSTGDSFGNKVKRCLKGIRCGSGANSIGDTVSDCEDVHIEVRDGIVKGATITDGTNTTAGATAISNVGNSAKLIADNTIHSKTGRFGRGINAPIQTRLVNNGILGTYSIEKIDTIVATFKLNNYDDNGVLS